MSVVKSRRSSLLAPIFLNTGAILLRPTAFCFAATETKNFFCSGGESSSLEKTDSQILKESHRNIFMAVKEILNNVVKHSGATSVSIKVNIENDMLNISINDNGNGFESENSFSGNGIKNMKHRISISGGRIDIESAIEKGTTLKMIIPLANIRKS